MVSAQTGAIQEPFNLYSYWWQARSGRVAVECVAAPEDPGHLASTMLATAISDLEYATVEPVEATVRAAGCRFCAGGTPAATAQVVSF